MQWNNVTVYKTPCSSGLVAGHLGKCDKIVYLGGGTLPDTCQGGKDFARVQFLQGGEQAVAGWMPFVEGIVTLDSCEGALGAGGKGLGGEGRGRGVGLGMGGGWDFPRMLR